jgi:hypothetical protein
MRGPRNYSLRSIEELRVVRGTVGAVIERVNDCNELNQQSAIADQQFGTSLTRYPYQSVVAYSKDIEKRMFQIADRRSRIADVWSILIPSQVHRPRPQLLRFTGGRATRGTQAR